MYINLNLVMEQGYAGIILTARKQINQDLSIKSTKNELLSYLIFVFLPSFSSSFVSFLMLDYSSIIEKEDMFAGSYYE